VPGVRIKPHPKQNLLKKFQKSGVVFSTEKLSINSPQSTSNPPRIHHKNTTQKHAFLQNPLKNTHKSAQIR